MSSSIVEKSSNSGVAISKISQKKLGKWMEQAVGIQGYTTLTWELPSDFDKPIPSFEWDITAENSQINRTNYMEFLEKLIKFQDPGTYKLMVAPKDLLSVANDFGKFNGTTDVVIVPSENENDNLHTLQSNIAGIIELKKPDTNMTNTKQAQAVLEHFLAMMLSPDCHVLTCLADLQKNWILFWLSKDGKELYKLEMGAAGAIYLLNQMFCLDTSDDGFPTDFCNRGTWNILQENRVANTRLTTQVEGVTTKSDSDGDDGDPDEEENETDVEDDKTHAEGESNETNAEEPSNETSTDDDKNKTNRDDASGNSVDHVSGRSNGGDVSRFGMEKSMKGKSEHAQGDGIIQRDSDKWPARMKMLDTGADVANELDLLDMLDDDQDRRDIVSAVIYRRLVSPLFPDDDESSDDETREDGTSVLTAANLERHLKSSGQQNNTLSRFRYQQ